MEKVDFSLPFFIRGLGFNKWVANRRIQDGRGLRQDDPLAPFLFLVVTERFHVMMEEAESKG